MILDKFIPTIPPKGTLILELENNDRTNVEVNFNPVEFKAKESASFSFRFSDSVSGQQISDVNYSIIIKDSEEKTLIDKSSQYAKDGEDIQTVEFSETGPVTVLIDIEGTGTKVPYDTSYSGETSFILTVVPGFDYSIILFLGLAVAASLVAIRYALRFSKRSKSLNLNL